MSRRDDETLLARGGADGFVEFYRRHERPVLGYFVRRGADGHLAAELTAEAFTRLLEARERFTDRGPGSAAGWLYGIARNVHLERIREAQRGQRIVERIATEPLDVTDEQRNTIERLSGDDELQTALDALPAPQAQAVWAVVVEDRPYREVSEQLQVPESTLRQRVSRGLRELREDLGRNER